MNRHLLGFLLVVLPGMASAQLSVQVDSVVNGLTEAYNAAGYPKLYNMLSTGFRNNVSEASITAFFSQNMRAPLGRIVSWRSLHRQNDQFFYKARFEHGIRSLVISLDRERKITYMMWKPLNNAGKIYTNNPQDKPYLKTADSLVRDFMSFAGNSAMAIALVNDSRCDTLYYGSPVRNQATHVNPETLFEIGSISKTFTGAVLAAALRSGKISLDEDIRKYLPGKFPGLEFNGKPITVRQLASHRSGLPRMPANFESQAGYSRSDPYRSYSRTALLNYLSDLKPDTLPGVRELYSNLGIAILGLVLESAMKMPVDEQIRTVVLSPLGMQHTTFDANQARGTKAVGYNGQTGAATSMWTMNDFNAAGGLKSNLPDMVSYVKENLKPRLAVSRLAQQRIAGSGLRGSGLCWIIDGRHDLVWHNGGTAGFSSYLGFKPGSGRGVVVLSNSDTNVDDLANRLLALIPEHH
ncbi:serine hydrolase [Pedobacter sp. SYP-B3415]|uniref:serine hydrolase n=1 Tax=Pedobacter sp. SYP-B3415 TaxID=2496641 RepID=UPI0013EC4574|nr:serine hydrolase [Pedobacter sp. SYP-B3415]